MTAYLPTQTEVDDRDTASDLIAAFHALRADIDSFAEQLDQHDEALRQLRAHVNGEVPIRDDINQTFDRLQRAADAAFARRWLRWLRWGR